ncbi:BPI fold-containing family A member 2 [Sturnira hondurensis]|uniref:BPI fold-containing family A member 2 n=1 Tax=Sturnira hondurensis TaxID=192404 RepID=UPI00187979C2|nr:BPI fold-containing family A member 2 [Sturnira hondurensis]XP_036899765.1 BPI fold-containing family A member 2 [Sturnira hondurensis]
MFQLWKVVLLCGLLTGTSASLLGDLGSDLNGVVNKGREIFEDTVQTVAGNLKNDLNNLQNSKLGQLAGEVLQKAEELLSGAVSKVLSINKSVLGVKLAHVNILDIKSKLTADGDGLTLSIPITADIELDLPVIGKTADLKLSVDLLNSVKIETKDGKSSVVPSSCSSDPATISLTLLDGRNELANQLADTASNFLSETLSALVENQICPLISLFAKSLGVNYVENTIAALVHELSKHQSSA